jgi:hypothetical protein
MNSIFQKKEYPKDVLEIHRELQTACEQILSEAVETLKKQRPPIQLIEKAKLLRVLGFAKAKQADIEEENEILNEGEMSKEIAEKISYYKFHYLDYKFITDEQIKIICNKYNLVFGKIDKYAGFVPEKNLKEIQKFTSIIKEEDMDKDIWSVGKGFVRSYGNIYAEYSDNSYEEYDDGGERARGKRYKHECQANTIDKHEYKIGYKNAKMRVCAPLNEMDMTEMELEEGYKMINEKIKVMTFPDPIVLQPVVGGYLIVTAWGDEAADEIVINPKHN